MTLFIIVGVIGFAIALFSLLVDDFLDGFVEGFGGDALSGPAMGGFLGAFGLAGGYVQSTGAPTGVAVLAGIVAGTALGGVAMLATRAMKKSDSTAGLGANQLLGARGTVVSAVPAGGLGRVNITASGQLVSFSARAERPDSAIVEGTRVEIVELLSQTSVLVRPVT